MGTEKDGCECEVQSWLRSTGLSMTLRVARNELMERCRVDDCYCADD